jgi:hypothetical protein
MLGVAVSVLIVGSLGAVAVSSLLPSAHLDKSDASSPKKHLATELTIPVGASICASCGTVESVRVVEVRNYEPEKNMQKHFSYRVTVRMEDGSLRTVSQSTAPTAIVGDRVRITKGALSARS